MGCPGMSRFLNLAIVLAALAAVAGGLAALALQGGESGEPVRILEESGGDVGEISEWRAYITGAVRRPGVYSIEEGARLSDLIDQAGGMTEEADFESVNLAVRVLDEDHWRVPSVGEGSSSGVVEAPGGKVDINRAGVEALRDLPGIGETRASAIVRYREEHGPFRRVDDIVEVPGIGPSTLEGVRDFVEAR